MQDEIKKQMDELATAYEYTTGPVGFKNGFSTCHDLMQSRIDEISKEADQDLPAIAFFPWYNRGRNAGYEACKEEMQSRIERLEKANRVMMNIIAKARYLLVGKNSTAEIINEIDLGLSEADKILESK